MLFTDKSHSICCLQIHPILPYVSNEMIPLLYLGLWTLFSLRNYLLPNEKWLLLWRNARHVSEGPVCWTLGDSPSPHRTNYPSSCPGNSPSLVSREWPLPTAPLSGEPFPLLWASVPSQPCVVIFWAPSLGQAPGWMWVTVILGFSDITWIVYLALNPPLVIIWASNFSN